VCVVASAFTSRLALVHLELSRGSDVTYGSAAGRMQGELGVERGADASSQQGLAGERACARGGRGLGDGGGEFDGVGHAGGEGMGLQGVGQAVFKGGAHIVASVFPGAAPPLGSILAPPPPDKENAATSAPKSKTAKGGGGSSGGRRWLRLHAIVVCH
jgi:hypothetical protein